MTLSEFEIKYADKLYTKMTFSYMDNRGVHFTNLSDHASETILVRFSESCKSDYYFTREESLKSLIDEVDTLSVWIGGLCVLNIMDGVVSV